MMNHRWQTQTKRRALQPGGKGKATGRGVGGLRVWTMCILMAGCLATIALAQGESASGMRGWIGVNLFQLIRTADAVGKLSLVVLAIFSVLSIAVMIYKFSHIRQAVKQTDAFIELCNQGSGELEEAFRHSADFPDSPLAQILREGYTEMEVENWYGGDAPEGWSVETQLEMVRISLERVFERVIAMEITHLESKLIFLATTSSVCPFIGLFGTVWGIMGAFQALSASGGGTLVTLGPGLSTALLTTVGGLFCAIPATVMYNFMTHQIRLLTAQMDSFAMELSNVIQKKVLKQATAMTLGRSL
jgi:biopolymer transport protein TolQ